VGNVNFRREQVTTPQRLALFKQRVPALSDQHVEDWAAVLDLNDWRREVPSSPKFRTAHFGEAYGVREHNTNNIRQEQRALPTDDGGKFARYQVVGGQERAVFVGPRGGHFYRRASGTKAYI
jgi:hypothetical protein